MQARGEQGARPSRLADVIHRIGRAVDGVVDRIVHGSDDPHVRARAQLLILYGTLSGASGVVWGVSHLEYGSPALLVAFFFVAATLIFMALGRLWVTRDVATGCRHALLLSFTATIVATYFTGGMRLTNICAFSALFLNPVFLLGRRGLPWSLSALGIALAMQAADWYGFIFPDVVPLDGRAADAFVTWFQAATTMIVFVLLYDRARAHAADRMRALVRAKSTLLANLSHEIRTPLHVMMGVNNLLASDHPTPAHAKLIGMSQDNAESLLAFFDDLIDLARIEHNTFALRPVDFDPVAVVEGVTQIIRHFSERSAITVRELIGADVPRRVRGDERRVRQVLLNLGVNAAKFTERGEIRVRVDALAGAPFACTFAVEDTGIGIDLKDAARIFDSFTQIDDSPARQHDGAGLGLAISRDLVRRMGGELTLVSTPGIGSTFSFAIRFDPPMTTAADAEAGSRRGPRTGARILLVEDLAINRELATVMLELAGYNVVTAASGAEGLARFKEAAADLVLMDIQMPGMDGFEVTRLIRHHEAEAHRPPVPIIALTGRASDHDRALAIGAGMTDCLFKPFAAEELRQIVGRYLAP